MITVMQWTPLIMVFCIFMAMVAVLIGWHWLKLARVVASIAIFLKDDDKTNGGRSTNILVIAPSKLLNMKSK